MAWTPSQVFAGLFGGVPKPLSVDSGNNLIQRPLGANTYNNAAGTAGHAVKAGAGVFTTFNVNTAGSATVATLYDGVDTGGVKLATIDTASIHGSTYNLAFTTGLFVVLTVSGAADVSIGYL